MVSIVSSVIQRVVLPDEAETVNFILTRAIGTLTARLAPEVEGIRLVDIQTQRVTERPFNPDLDGPAPPPFPSNLFLGEPKVEVPGQPVAAQIGCRGGPAG